MAARAGMTSLINRIRGMTNAGTADWSLGTAYFWDDEHIQEVLDANRSDFFECALQVQPQTGGGGSVYYKRYTSQYQNLESVESGTLIFNLYKAAGEQIGGGTTEFSVDYYNGIITFDNDQRGTAWYLSGRSYDLNNAAADIWEKKAAHYTEAYDISTDNQSLKRSQLLDHCLEMADKYRSMAGANSIEAERSDTW